MGMETDEVRRLNVQYVIDENYEGVKLKLAQALEIEGTSVSRWFSKGKQRRAISVDSARRIESVSGYDRGWLDVPHSQLWELNAKELFDLELSYAEKSDSELTSSLSESASLKESEIKRVLSGDIVRPDSRYSNLFSTLKAMQQIRQVNSKGGSSVRGSVYPPEVVAIIDRYQKLSDSKKEKLHEFMTFLEASK